MVSKIDQCIDRLKELEVMLNPFRKWEVLSVHVTSLWCRLLSICHCRTGAIVLIQEKLQPLAVCQDPRGRCTQIKSFCRCNTPTYIMPQWKNPQRLAEIEFCRLQCHQPDEDMNRQKSNEFSHMWPNPNPRMHIEACCKNDETNQCPGQYKANWWKGKKLKTVSNSFPSPLPDY